MLVYVICLVDKLEKGMKDFQSDELKIQWIRKGQQMRGLRFKHTRPTKIIDFIEERSLIIRGEERFEDWWNDCVVPQMTPCTSYSKGVRE